MTSTPTPRPTRRAARPAFAALAIASLGLFAACGGGSDSSATDSSSPSSQGSTGSSSTDQVGAPQGNGTSGLVADVSGSTAQVQTTSDGQVAVSWNGSTTFTAEVSSKLSAVKVGSCVMVTPADSSSGSSNSSEVAAGSVRVLAASTDGTCSMGFGGGGGGSRPSGAPSGMPSDMPSDMPSAGASGGPGGGPGGSGRGGFGTFGKVTAVSGTGFTVESAMPSMPGGASDSASDSTGSTSTATVTVSSSTTYTATEKSTAAAVKTGVCVSARGEADSTGAVTASTISVSTAVDGACTSGFGGGRRGQGGQGGSTTGSAS